MIYFLIFIFGTIIGSFLNVVSLRYNTGESLVFSGSRCFSCGKKLFWRELIPILSFLIQKGRCRQCKSKISWQYPIVEFLTGLLFLAIAWKFGFQLETEFPSSLLITSYWLLITGLLIVISVYDIRHQIIPSGLVYTLIILSFFSGFLEFGILNLFENWKLIIENSGLLNRFLAGIVFGAFFALLWLASRGKWMGLGDAKLALAAGWLLGFLKGAIAVIFSFWLGALAGVFLLLFFPKNFTIKSRIPFGPFLCLGTMVVILFSDEIIKIYFNLLNLWT